MITGAAPSHTVAPQHTGAAGNAPTDDEILGIDIGAPSTKRPQHRPVSSPRPTHSAARSAPPRGIFAPRNQTAFPSASGVGSDASVGADLRSAGVAADSGPMENPMQASMGEEEQGGAERGEQSQQASQEPEELKEIFEANPELRQAWQAEKEFREVFPTVEDARAAQTQVADLAQLDELFFSGQPDAHADLAAAVYRLNPAAFRSLAQAMADTLANADGASTAAHGRNQPNRVIPSEARDPSSNPLFAQASQRVSSGRQTGPQNDSIAQAPPNAADAGQFAAFYHETNAAVVEGVVDAIRSQVERLLPEGIAPGAQNRVVGEIYRELDASLRNNRALATQVRQAFRSGAMDADHQVAVVGLILGRARQALPVMAKRVINEWTTGVLAASDQKLARQRAAEGRVDITGGAPGSAFKRALTPKDVDYAKLSDGDILNL